MHIIQWKENLSLYTKELEEKLLEIKDISDLEKQWKEINSAKNVFGIENKLNELIRSKPDSVTRGYDSDLNKYEELLEELKEVGGEVAKKSNEERKKSKDKLNNKNDIPPKKQKQYTCAECGEIKKGKYKCHKSKKDNQKFCSDNCFYQHYAEKCDNCLEKCLIYSKGKATGYAQTYYSDGINMTGTLCSKCHTEKLKEEEKKDKEWEENSKKLKKNMDELVDGMVETVGKGKEEELDDSEVNDKDSKEVEDNNKENNPIVSIERERERERDKNLTQQQQLLSQIHQLESNPSNNQTELNSKKQQLKDLQSKEKQLITSLPIDTQISILEKEIKELTNKPSKTKVEEKVLESKRKELERLLSEKNKSNTNSDKPKDRTGLYVGCGIFIAFTLLLILVLARNRQKKRIKHK